jgi:hypothetical protein
MATLEHDVTQINNANITYGAYGPNSSSALRYLLQSLDYLEASTGGLAWYSIPVWMQTLGYNALLPGLETWPSNPSPPRAPIYHY